MSPDERALLLALADLHPANRTVYNSAAKIRAMPSQPAAQPARTCTSCRHDPAGNGWLCDYAQDDCGPHLSKWEPKTQPAASVPCSMCKGDGMMGPWSARFVCLDCHGTGVVPAKTEGEQP